MSAVTTSKVDYTLDQSFNLVRSMMVHLEWKKERILFFTDQFIFVSADRTVHKTRIKFRFTSLIIANQDQASIIHKFKHQCIILINKPFQVYVKFQKWIYFVDVNRLYKIRKMY